LVRTVAAKPNDLIVVLHDDRMGRKRKVVAALREQYRMQGHFASLFA
jgi:hypothetical protein